MVLNGKIDFFPSECDKAATEDVFRPISNMGRYLYFSILAIFF